MTNDMISEIHAQVAELAAACGNPGISFSDHDNIPESGLLDSAAIIELVNWVEKKYSMMIDEDEITIENLGSVNLIATFVRSRKGV